MTIPSNRSDRPAAPAQSGTGARRAKGFLRAGGLIDAELRAAARKHGFAETRILTHWAEIAGPDIAAIARPVKMRRSPGGGAILTLLVEGPRAPEMQMRLPVLRGRLAAALGPAAVHRIAITQGAARTDLAAPRTSPEPPPPLPPGALDPVRPSLDAVADAELRAALETLAANVLSRRRTAQSTGT